ncbi:MAG: hypothetical protein Q7R87_01480 [Nanoarchaeota archaeon]|nr:hypothetical protein [Nanoarchaeota archaeon]
MSIKMKNKIKSQPIHNINLTNNTSKDWYIHQQSISELKRFYKIPSKRWVILDLKNYKNVVLSLYISDNYIRITDMRKGQALINKFKKMKKPKAKSINCISCDKLLWADVFKPFPSKYSYMPDPLDKYICEKCEENHSPKLKCGVVIFNESITKS